MKRRQPRSTRTDTLFPYTTLFRSDELDEALGLAMGADDYISKPFSHRLLIARIRAVLRRAESRLSENDDEGAAPAERIVRGRLERSEEHTSELQSLMRISYAVFCLTKKN